MQVVHARRTQAGLWGWTKSTEYQCYARNLEISNVGLSRDMSRSQWINSFFHSRLDGSRGFGSYYIYGVPQSRVVALNATGKYISVQANVSKSSCILSLWACMPNLVFKILRELKNYPMVIKFPGELLQASKAGGVSLSWTKWGGPTSA